MSSANKYKGLAMPVLLESLTAAHEETGNLLSALLSTMRISEPAPAPAPAPVPVPVPVPAAGGAGASASVSADADMALLSPAFTEAERAASVDRVCTYIARSTSVDIPLLRRRDVIQWIFGDTSFLPAIHKKNKTRDTVENKKGEDEWGRAVMKERRPDLALEGQWTNRFGEYLAQEIHTLLGKPTTKPVKKHHFQPDWETDDAIVEVKTGTYFTTGTAHEKILGAPFKYAEVPTLYGKPLKILCIGGAEPMARGYGLFPGEACTPARRRQLTFWKEGGIEFLEATTVLLSLLPPTRSE